MNPDLNVSIIQYKQTFNLPVFELHFFFTTNK